METVCAATLYAYVAQSPEEVIEAEEAAAAAEMARIQAALALAAAKAGDASI